MDINSAYWAKEIQKVHPRYRSWMVILKENFKKTDPFYHDTPSDPKELMDCFQRVHDSRNSNHIWISNDFTENPVNISKNTKYTIICVLIIAFFFWFSFGFAKGSKAPTFDFILANVNIFTLPTWLFLPSFIVERKKQINLQYLLDQFHKAYKEEHS